MTARLPLKRTLAPWILAACAAVSGSAHAQLTSLGGGSFDVEPMYRTLSYGSINFEDPTIKGVDYVSNVIPYNVPYQRNDFVLNGATFTGIGQSAFAGFYAGRNFASIDVANANSADDYYQVSGQGSATTVRFFSAQAQAQRATFTFRVTGGETNSAGYGQATGRLDFGATTDPTVNWLNLFDDPMDKLDSITELGPGTYTYNLPMVPFGTEIKIFYWSSAFAYIAAGEAIQGDNVRLTANYYNTFVLDQVQLYDANDVPLTQWSMEDMSSGDVVFDETGRLAPVIAPPPIPEPGTYGLMLAGLVAVAGIARRRRG